MVQYLHFRILEFPLIFSRYNPFGKFRHRLRLRIEVTSGSFSEGSGAKNAGCLVEVFPAEISH
jgi:hypothetical protein